MTGSTKKGLLVVSIVLLGGGIAAYFYFKNKNKPANSGGSNNGNPDASTNNGNSSSTPSNNASTSSGTKAPAAAQTASTSVPAAVSFLNSKQAIISFQNFANAKGYSLTVDGVLGPKTMAAWNSLWSTYTSSSKSSNNSAQPSLPAGLVKADDVLSTSTDSAKGRQLYATNDGVGVYNGNNQLSFRTKRGQFLGIVGNAQPSSAGGYLIYFLSTGKTILWIPSAYAAIKTG